MVIDTSCHCGDVRPLSCNKMRFDYRMKIMRYTTFFIASIATVCSVGHSYAQSDGLIFKNDKYAVLNRGSLQVKHCLLSIYLLILRRNVLGILKENGNLSMTWLFIPNFKLLFYLSIHCIICLWMKWSMLSNRIVHCARAPAFREFGHVM